MLVRVDVATSASGVLADAHGSSPEKGQWLMDDHVRKIGAAVRKEFGL